MRRQGRSARRRHLVEDSDTDTEDGYDSNLERPAVVHELGNMCTLAAIQMEDLGSDRRHKDTSVDFKTKPVHLGAIMAGRKCNELGSRAANLAAKNKPQLTGWNNYGNTAEAKADIIEELPDISGGQAHRKRNQELRDELERQLGRELTLEDTYDDHGRRGPGFLSKGARGGSHVTASDRGQFKTRGGGNAGRFSGRAPATKKTTRPLDPAVDPDRVYVYKDKSRRGGGGKTRTSFDNNVVKVTASVPAGPQSRAMRGKASTGKPSPGLATSDKITVSQAVAARITARPLKANNPTLSEPADFMAAISGMLPVNKPRPAPPVFADSSTVQATSSLMQSKHASVAPSTDARNRPAQIQRMDRSEFRNPSTSPANLTDALPSPAELSLASQSLGDEVDADPLTSGVGLGIQIDMPQQLNATKRKSLNSVMPLKTSVIGDTNNPDTVKEVASLRTNPKSPAEGMVSISREDAEKWSCIKSLMQAGDTAGLIDILRIDVPTANTKSMSQDVKSTIIDEKVSTATANFEIGAGYKIDPLKMDTLIGNSRCKVLGQGKGKANQTTPSLAASKWAVPQAPSIGSSQFDLARGSWQLNEPTIPKPEMAPSTNQFGQGSTQTKPNINPFTPREPSSYQDSFLDYGEPAELKEATKGSKSLGSQKTIPLPNRPILEPVKIGAQHEKAKAASTVAAKTKSNGIHSGLAASKYATSPPTSTVKPMPTFKKISPNKIVQTTGTSLADQTKAQVPQSNGGPIFGDSRVLSCFATTTTAEIPFKDQKYNKKLNVPSPGYELLLKDLREAEAAKARAARANDGNESDESEL